MKYWFGFLPWLLLLAPLWGQNQTPGQSPAQPAQTQPPQSPQAQSADRTKNNTNTNGDSNSDSQMRKNGTSKDRLFFALPDFLTVSHAADVPPLSAGEKFKVTARDTFDPIELLWYGAVAGIAQAENHEPEYGQGVAGYAQRYAIRFADGTIENFMVKAVFPSVLHQDPRYYQLGEGTFWHRLGYAVSRVVVTRSDSGSAQVNFSEILGSATAAGISTYAYHTHDEKNVANAMDVWAVQVAYDTLSYAVKEFWPDIHRKLHPSKPGQAQ